MIFAKRINSQDYPNLKGEQFEVNYVCKGYFFLKGQGKRRYKLSSFEFYDSKGNHIQKKDFF